MIGRRIFLSYLLAYLLAVLCIGQLLSCASLDQQQRVRYQTQVEIDTSIPAPPSGTGSTLKVASLNLAHGRKDSLNQFFLSEETIRANLDDIARVFRQQQVDIIALQEADGPSLWSGSFDHVDYLARAAGYPWRIHAWNTDNWFATYGTALLSRVPLREGIEYTFEPSPPTLSKGFVLTSIDWPVDNGETRILDIISVHLDFSSQSVRDRQIHEMREIMASRMHPTILLGDFNSEWLQQNSVINELARKSRFTTFQPKSNAYNSYKDKRLDWILITRDMEFVSYRVLPDILSDHQMIIAEIKFKTTTGQEKHAPD